MTRVWTATPPFSASCDRCFNDCLKYTIFTDNNSTHHVICHECVTVRDNSVPYVLVEHPQGYTDCYSKIADAYTHIDHRDIWSLRDFVIKKI